MDRKTIVLLQIKQISELYPIMKKQSFKSFNLRMSYLFWVLSAHFLVKNVKKTKILNKNYNWKKGIIEKGKNKYLLEILKKLPAKLIKINPLFALYFGSVLLKLFLFFKLNLVFRVKIYGL